MQSEHEIATLKRVLLGNLRSAIGIAEELSEKGIKEDLKEILAELKYKGWEIYDWEVKV